MAQDLEKLTKKLQKNSKKYNIFGDKSQIISYEKVISIT